MIFSSFMYPKQKNKLPLAVRAAFTISIKVIYYKPRLEQKTNPGLYHSQGVKNLPPKFQPYLIIAFTLKLFLIHINVKRKINKHPLKIKSTSNDLQ
jgi:hypothetical protein